MAEFQVSSSIKRASQRLATATVVVAVLLLVFMVGAFVEVANEQRGKAVGLVLQSLFLLPGFFYFWALGGLRRSLIQVARGAVFEQAAVKGLSHLGYGLVGSGITSIIIVPVLAQALLRLPSLEVGGRPTNHVVQIDAAHVVLIFVGLALLGISHLFAIAAQYREENESLQNQLGEFL